MNTIAVEIVTPERVVYRGDARIVVARGVEGDLGILPNHIPMVTPLKIAPVLVKKHEGEDDKIAVSGGIMEVRRDKVTILAETAELPDEIDVDRARAAKERAERRLAENEREDIDFKRAQLALQRAMTRLDVAGK
ncbi:MULTISPECIES: F0F1 ATP synthase subunit epsilon [Aneurinibacillus]|uniref:ATP synthase epsilon chain n=1 Tax=Aneurinibacillus thermoaerophilus TaxID=143495 RepID=A0A1G8A0R2_ANETH|nr:MULTISPECIES: F0F1 ATP synthase subunit epsilon [Aneurinibacillus]AMA71643.1 ATP synthase F1 subunit epsilon [Aneurinibacillus sp. XH2]MED0676090.1 F0F1 ATP synthase subunit epsilon [Aneurinibacillus thermoaerophilus]MED0680810.1 F0F1 ATP synthase subunit epsilon [Aneurinibacillus thermoaerophilus]MED0738355.1 F0F1 ATP synthase subunit epsilon [Aneurinibacillus thermoaerophilus]MED0757627.1 F0F1 ATP synthase subunit epsilon [Aneurinibacillus thermoaerophilus]